MKPLSLLLVMGLIWAATNFWWIPLVSKSWKASSVRQQVTRAGVLAVLEKLRDLALVACVTLLLVLLLVSLANASAASSSLSRSVLHATETMYATAKAWNEKYALALTWITSIGVVICLYLAGRAAKQRVTYVWSEKAAEVLQGFRHTTNIDEARADPRLKPLVDSLDNAIIQFQTLRDAKPPTDQQILERKRIEISEWLNLLAMEIAAKDLDMEAALSTHAPWEKEADSTVKPTRWSKLRTLLISDQLAKDLGLVRKPMSYVMTGLLVISLVGWTAEPMANSLRLAVNNLRVNLLAEETNRDLRAVSEEPAEDDSASPESQSEDVPNSDALPLARDVARMLAHAATNDVLRAPLLQRTSRPDDAVDVTQARRANRASRADLVRAALLDVSPADTSGSNEYNNSQAAKAAGKVQAETAADLTGDRTSPLSERTSLFRNLVEEQILPDLERLRRSDPGTFERLARRATARYATPITALDAQSRILGEMIGQAFRGVDLEPTGEAAKQGQRLIKDFGQKSFHTWASSRAKRFVVNEILDAARPGVITRMRGHFAFAGSEATERLMTELATVDGAAKRWTQSTAALEESRLLNGVKAAANDVLPNVPGNNDELQRSRQAALRRVDLLQDYSTLFPGAGGGPDASRTAINFHRARVSSRIRGVIIGRDLAGPDLEIRGLRWQERRRTDLSTLVHLELMVGDRWTSIGRFDAAVVNQALRYAADLRVIATTILPGDGLVIGRTTNTHPALIDTPLGCRLIELDRLVDSVSAIEVPPPSLASLANDRAQMWHWISRAEIIQQISLAQPALRSECIVAASQMMEERDTPVNFSQPLSRGFSRFIAGLQGRHGSDSGWLKSVHACNEDSGGALAECMCDQGMKSRFSSNYWFPEDHTSQVREKKAQLASDLTWLSRSPDRLAHLDFAVHTTFSVRSPDDGEAINEDWADAYDFPSSQIAALRATLQDWIPTYVAGRGGRGAPVARSYEDFMAPVEDFILLQRLFRAGLTGQLGDDFPLAVLPRLQRETREFVPRQPTVRWELSAMIDEAVFVEKLRARNSAAEIAYSAWSLDNRRRMLSGEPTCDVVSR